MVINSECSGDKHGVGRGKTNKHRQTDLIQQIVARTNLKPFITLSTMQQFKTFFCFYYSKSAGRIICQ